MLQEKFRTAQVVAFDWEGTVIDSVEPKLRQNMALARQFNNPLTQQQVRDIWAQATDFTDLMQQLCQTDDMGAIMQAASAEYNNPEYAKKYFTYDTLSPIKHIAGIGYRVALLTSLTRERLNTDVEALEFPLHDLFEYIQTADDTVDKKPNGNVFKPLANHFGITANQLVYIGDELKDYAATLSFGAHFIGVESGLASAADFDTSGALHVPSVSDLLVYR